MRTFAFLSVLALGSFAFVATGCSGADSSDPFGPEPDYAALEQRLSSPTGTLSERNMSALFTRYGEQSDTSAVANVGVGSSQSTSSSTGTATPTATTRSQALHILGGRSGLTAGCTALAQGNLTGSCSCPSGGSFTYDFGSLGALRQSSGPIDASLKVRFEGCHTGEVGIDGREFVHVHADRGGSSVDVTSLDMLLVADLTVSKGAERHTVDLAAMLRDGQLEIALAVDDGWVTVRAVSTAGASSGSFVVRDRNGSWTCDVEGGAGTCRNEDGDVRAF